MLYLLIFALFLRFFSLPNNLNSTVLIINFLSTDTLCKIEMASSTFCYSQSFHGDSKAVIIELGNMSDFSTFCVRTQVYILDYELMFQTSREE